MLWVDDEDAQEKLCPMRGLARTPGIGRSLGQRHQTPNDLREYIVKPILVPIDRGGRIAMVVVTIR